MTFERSSLENYTSNNTSQHDTTRVQHDITRDNTSNNTSQHNTSKTRDNTRQHEYDTTQN